jgi:hypothetical protein
MTDRPTGAHAFQGIVTKLQTTKGTPYALDVMREAVERIEAVLALHPVTTWLEHTAYEDPQAEHEGCTLCRTEGPCETRRALDGPRTPLQHAEGQES